MRRPDRIDLRLFLTAWLVFSAHFATNVVREHYPAFSLVERGDLILDAYEGFHSDIFVHDDGHNYIGNQVATSLLAAVPLLVFDPVLDWLQERRLEQLSQVDAPPESEYRTEYPLRQEFFRKVKERGLDLRFGASTAITTAFFMAPLSALLCVWLRRILVARGVPRRRALLLALLFAFATPVFYRTATLNNNMLLMYAVFASFALLWRRPDEAEPVSVTRRALGGFCAFFAVAVDYAGGVSIPFLYAYLVLTRVPRAGWGLALRESVPFLLGGLPALGILWGTQYWMYGDPFLPGQYHMPTVNYTDEGWRGISLPQPDLFLANLVSPNWGLFTFGPLLVLAFLPVLRVPEARRVLPRAERRFVWAYVLGFLLFCAANQYSRMQWNTGFRYLLPLVPLLFLVAADHLAHWPRRLVLVLGGLAALHTWVLCQVRFTVVGAGAAGTAEGNAVLESWSRVLEGGLQLPWLNVLRQTSPPEGVLHLWVWPYALLGLVGALVAAIWLLPRRRAEG